MKTKTIYTNEVLKDYQAYTFTRGIKRVRCIEAILLFVLFLYNFFFMKRIVVFQLLYIVAFLICIEAFMRYTTWKKFKKDNMELHAHEITYDFQEEQVYVKSVTSDIILRYAQVKRLIETPYSFFLFESKQDAYIVDKNNLTNDDEDTIRQLLYKKRVPYQKKRTRFL